MLFNSTEFIFLFLPAVLVIFYVLKNHWGGRGANLFLVSASLFFYGWWNPQYLVLIISSILLNYKVSCLIADRKRRNQGSLAYLVFGITANLLTLSYFKYALFITSNFALLFGTNWQLGQIVLPLAISFFTFQQIAYLVDSHKGIVDPSNTGLEQYSLFVLFFPQLIAGPIVHHREMIPQFLASFAKKVDWQLFTVGVCIFSIGLFKKVVFADTFAEYSSPVFDSVADAKNVTSLEAWGAILAYTLQIYFDFSGYSDMAYGLACLFGIKLPINFLSPYKSASVNEFWRRWHITLGSFFKDYIYIPLGGNRAGAARMQFNLIFVMFVCGFWHGAGWSFVMWGVMHGMGSVSRNLWVMLLDKLGVKKALLASKVYHLLAVALTFLFVSLCWVMFRAADFESALRYYQILLQLDLMQLGDVSAGYCRAIYSWVVHLPGLGNLKLMPAHVLVNWLLIGLTIVFLLPNSFELLYKASSSKVDATVKAFTPAKALLVAFLLLCALLVVCSTTSSEFLYYVF